MSFFQKIKDAGINVGCEAVILYVNKNQMKGIGTMLDLKIDSKSKSASTSILLKGEKEKLDIKIGSYSFQNNKLTINEVTTSREWLNVVLETQFSGEIQIDLDENLIKLISTVL